MKLPRHIYLSKSGSLGLHKSLATLSFSLTSQYYWSIPQCLDRNSLSTLLILVSEKEGCMTH